MRVLLIGGTGFIGQYLARRLALKNRVSVVHFSSLKPQERVRHATYYRIDLAKYSPKLKILVRKADTVVTLIQPNFTHMQNIIKAIGGSVKLKKIVYVSTLFVYPDLPSPQSEKAKPTPVTEYERKKYKEELMISAFAAKYNYPLTIIRMANVYGDVKNRGVINHIFLSLLRGSELVLRGSGDQHIRDYIFVEDAAQLIEFFIFYKQRRQREVVNLATRHGHTINEVIGIIEKNTGEKVKFRVERAIRERKFSIGDNKKMLKLSHYQFKYDLTRGLKKTYNNYLKVYS